MDVTGRVIHVRELLPDGGNFLAVAAPRRVKLDKGHPGVFLQDVWEGLVRGCRKLMRAVRGISSVPSTSRAQRSLETVSKPQGFNG